MFNNCSLINSVYSRVFIVASNEKLTKLWDTSGMVGFMSFKLHPTVILFYFWNTHFFVVNLIWIEITYFKSNLILSPCAFAPTFPKVPIKQTEKKAFIRFFSLQNVSNFVCSSRHSSMVNIVDNLCYLLPVRSWVPILAREWL